MRYLILLLFSTSVLASRYDHEVTINQTFVNETIEETYVTEEYITENYITQEYFVEPILSEKAVAKLMSLAVATNHPFDYVTKDYQFSVNSAWFSGESSLSFGLAKRFDNIDALFHSTYGQANGEHAVTFGALWRF
jgi:hypothetical protein